MNAWPVLNKKLFIFAIIKSEALKLNNWDLERELRKSPMDYSLKATQYLYGISQTPCPNCPFKNEYPPVPFEKKTKKCFERCKFKIIIWILNQEQLSVYEQFRPPEKKKKDIELAINEGKIALVEEILRGSQEIVVFPSFFSKI
jgi:hypothetical protein